MDIIGIGLGSMSGVEGVRIYQPDGYVAPDVLAQDIAKTPTDVDFNRAENCIIDGSRRIEAILNTGRITAGDAVELARLKREIATSQTFLDTWGIQIP